MRNRLCYSIAILLVFCSGLLGQSKSSDYQYALIEAVKQKNLGNLPGAIELYQMVIQENDSVAVAHYELGTLLALTGDKEKALEELERAHQLVPDNEWFFESYVDVLLMNEEFKEAERVLLKKNADNPETVEYSFNLANVYFLSGKNKKAIKILNSIEKKYGISDRVILLKATIFEKDKSYDKALTEVNKIIALFPESVEYNVVAAELAMKSKQEKLAMEYYLEVMQLDSSNIYAITNLTDYYRDINELEKSFYYLNKSFASSEIEYEKKMAILSYYLSDKKLFNEQAPQLEALILTMQDKYPKEREPHLFGADFYIQHRNYRCALKSILPLLVVGEKHYELWRQGVLLANATNETETLLELTDLASSLFPDSSEISFYKGLAEYGLEQYDSVIFTYTSMAVDEDDAVMATQVRELLAESYFRIENFHKSDSLYRAIIKEEPDNYIAKNNFAYYLSLRNESLEEAKEYSYSTIQNNPENATFLDTYAWILYRLKDYKGAEKYIMEAINLGGENDADVNEHAADIHVAIGSIQLARAYYQKALILGGEKDKILKKLNDISGQNDH